MQSPRISRSLFSPTDLDATARQVVYAPPRLSPSQAWLPFVLSLALGALADALFNGAPMGINVAVWLLASAGSLLIAGIRSDHRVERSQLAMMALAFLLALMLAWRASPVLQALNFMAMAGLLMLAVALPRPFGRRSFSPVAVVLAGCVVMTSMTSSAWRLTSMLPWREKMAPHYRTEALSIGRALALSTPIFLMFGGLFFAADAVFAEEVKSTFTLDIQAIRGHLLWTLGGAWLAASLLWSAVGIDSPQPLEAEMPEARRLKALETGIVLAPLALLFGLFVIVQVRYLFGGQDAVQDSISLTYSQYARKGFFELVVASLLLLPVLTGVNWARKREHVSNRLFAGLALVLVALLFVVMASAAQRLSIYVDAFGLTQLRFYSVVVLPWLAVAFVWFLGSLALRRDGLFFGGATAAGVVLLIVLNAVNPDGLIARTNLDLAADGHTFDSYYAMKLSADAVPSLLDGLTRLDTPQRCEIAEEISDRWASRSDDVRGWNFGRWQAHQRVASAGADLLLDCPVPGRS